MIQQINEALDPIFCDCKVFLQKNQEYFCFNFFMLF
jgi:hypothetical protein